MNYLKTLLNLSLISLIGMSVACLPEAAQSKSLSFSNNSTLKQKPSISSQLEQLTGIWEGSYICGQGLTRLRLAINARSTSEIDALFIFSAHPNNPGVPSGMFAMQGTYQIFGLSEMPNRLELNATEWIQRPSGYGTVDLAGTLYLEENRLIGDVTNCSTFDVERVSDLDEAE